MLRYPLLFLVCLVAFATVAMADDHEVCPDVHASSAFLSPDGHMSWSSLDDPQPDNIFYDDVADEDQLYFTSLTNYWSMVRFTAPGHFYLREVAFRVDCSSDDCGAAVCSVFVCQPYTPTTLNRPGTILTSLAVTLTEPGWVDVNLPDTLEFWANQSFMVVVGRATGIATGWVTLLDGGTSTFRSYVTASGGSRTQAFGNPLSYDIRIRAGGLFGAYTDVQPIECYNQISPDGPGAFFVTPGTPVTLKTSVFNPSNSTAASFNTYWTVKNSAGATVFTDTVAGTNLAAQESVVMTASLPCTTSTVGAYLATCIVRAVGDSFIANDTTKLRYFVAQYPMMYRYDDNATADGYVNFGAGIGIGVSYKPTAYPVQIDSLRFFVNASGSADVMIFANGQLGPEGEAIYSATQTFVQGWNRFAVRPTLTLTEGNGFTAVYMQTSDAGPLLGKDGTPPNEAAIQSIDTTTYQTNGSIFVSYPTGNWQIQAKLLAGVVPPTISTSADTLFFGTCDTTGHATVERTLWVRNAPDAGANLDVTGIVFAPTTPVVYSVDQSVFEIAPGDSAALTVTFDPTSNRAYNYTMRLNNNSSNAPALVIALRGTGVAQAVEIPGLNLPTQYALAQNFPNPFNPTTEIRFALPTTSHVRLSVFNMLGQEIATLVNETMPAGNYMQSFDASKLPAGIYFYRMDAGSFTDVRKMMLLK